jgi:hypothetical protein
MYYTNIKSNAANHEGCVNRVTGTKRVKFSVLAAITLSTLLVLATMPAQATDEYQYNALFMPSDYTLKAEAKGRVMIYDGLASKTVDKAMNEQFNRIDNMMFVRIVHEQDDGEYYVEDDGCD